MAKRIKQLKRGLFTRTVTSISIDLNSPEEDLEAKAFFDQQKYGADLVDKSLDVLRAAAQVTLRKCGLSEATVLTDELQGNAALGLEILQHIELLEGHRKHGRTEDAIYEAMKATELWMELRTNLFFEAPVQEKQTRRRAAQKVTDEQICKIMMVKKPPTQVVGAGLLGMSERQLSERLKKINRKR